MLGEQILYLEILPLFGQALPHCEGQAKLLAYWYVQGSNLTSTEPQENWICLWFSPDTTPHDFSPLIDLSDSSPCE